ncbi:MAG: ABC transporter ATP-binding protein [Lachnospiraceae bacterium]|nr:ABC transporter ATP-binding protein [Lachnospiraceae bacterium]
MILQAEHITKTYGENQVLQNVSVTLQEGELVCLLGVSGVGKTTLFNILSGLTLPDSGKVLLEGNDITGKTGYLSYMQQKDLLLPHKTVLDNVALPLVLNGVKKREARERAAEYFSQFGLAGTEQQYPVQLSGGMRQRAALLRTYMCGDKVALLDEPFSALDTLTRTGMQEWYLKVMEEIKLSTLFITHDIDEAILLSDRIYIMSGNPAGISAELVVEEPKPRSGEFLLSDTFMEYKRRIKRNFTLR